MNMPRRDFLMSAAMAGVGGSALAGATTRTLSGSKGPPVVQERPQQPHGKATHSILDRDHPYIFVDSCMQMWPDADFDVAHRHGVSTYAVTAWTPHVDAAAALEGLMYWHWVARRYENLPLVRAVEDIRTAKRLGRAGLLLAAQDGGWIGTELHRVEAFHALGLRMMLLAYNTTNQLCDGCLDRTDGGLTRLGQLVVDECNRVGIVLDLSHTGKRATLEIMERSEHPCVFSHSNPSALVPNPRNIDDEQIRVCAEGGGVIGLCSWGPLVMRPASASRPTLDDYLDHLDYVAQLTGSADHLGISTDMSIGTYPQHETDVWGVPGVPNITERYDRYVTADVTAPERNVAGFSDYAEVVTVADRLQDRGFSEGDAQNILGENFLRVFGKVWGA